MNSTKLREWVKVELKTLRLDYMQNKGAKDGVTSVVKFAARAKISKEHVYKLERGHSSPTVETLNDWVEACDTSLYAFFQKLISEAELDEVGRKSAKDAEVLRVLRNALTYSATRKFVTDTAVHVSEFLRLSKSRRPS